MFETERQEPVVPPGILETDEQILAGLRDYKKRSKILRENHDELIAKYPYQWVALGDNWVFVVADSHAALLDKLRQCGAHTPNSVTRCLEVDPPRRIPTLWRRRKP